MGSRSPLVTTFEQWTELKLGVEKVINNRAPKDMWLALDDIAARGNGPWMDYYDHSVVNFSLPWAPGEPNGGTTENCVVYQTSSGLFDYIYRKFL